MRLVRALNCCVIVASVFATIGCSHASSRLDVGANLGDDNARSRMPKDAFVGWIRDVRGSVIIVDEEVATSGRRGEIFVATTTEILSRMGMIVPQSWLKRGLRVTVEFRGTATEQSGNLSATAQKIVVDM
jgi:hypothetical protein